MTESTDFPSASGIGAELFSDRALFFLQHREQIERWGGLRNEASEAVSKFLESLSDALPAVSSDWISWAGHIGKYRCLGLVPRMVGATEFPWVGVMLGWSPGVMPDSKNRPWVGVYLYPEHPSADAVRAALDVRDASPAERKYSSSAPWPRFLWKGAASEWWMDLDGYRQELVDEFTTLFLRYRVEIESTCSDSP